MNAKKQLELLIRTLQAIKANTKIDNENALIRFYELCEHYRLNEQLVQMERITHIYEDEATTEFQAETRIKQLYCYRSQIDDLCAFWVQMSMLEKQDITLAEQEVITETPTDVFDLNEEQINLVHDFWDLVRNTPNKYTVLLSLMSLMKIRMNVAMELSDLYELTNLELPDEEPPTIQETLTPTTEPEQTTLKDEELREKVKNNVSLFKHFLYDKDLQGEWQPLSDKDKIEAVVSIINIGLEAKKRGVCQWQSMVFQAIDEYKHTLKDLKPIQFIGLFSIFGLDFNNRSVSGWKNTEKKERRTTEK